MFCVLRFSLNPIYALKIILYQQLWVNSKHFHGSGMVSRVLYHQLHPFLVTISPHSSSVSFNVVGWLSLIPQGSSPCLL